jgi:hypothetical protein
LNYLNEKKICLKSLKAAAFKHQRWAMICFAALVLLESFFIIYPPRGYIAEDYVTIGSIKGKPLVMVQNLWESKISNDDFMLAVLEKAAVKSFNNRSDALAYLNSNIRKNLRFSSINETLFKISFVQPAASRIRPFLNAFTQSFLQHMATISDEELQNRRRNAIFQFKQLLRRNLFIYELFEPLTAFDKIVPGPNGQLAEIDAEQENSWLGKAALVLLNELNRELFRAQVYVKSHTDEKQKILELYPFTQQRLTDPEMPPQPVQPFLVIFYFFVALSVLLFWLASLVYLVSGAAQEEADATGS